MKKKVFYMLIIVAAATIGAINVNTSKSTKNITFKNIEALARGEGGVNIKCCAGLWGTCKTASGTESKAPYIECSM